MIVYLTYFRQSGKYYSQSEYETKKTELWMIWNEVENLQIIGTLPGLVYGAREFIILISVPEHQYNHPHLIMPKFDTERVKYG